MTVTPILVDRRNYNALVEHIRARVAEADLLGYDIETADPRKHEGLVEISKGKKLVFDINRTDLCGLSIYPDKTDASFYFSVGHADVENRLTWREVEYVLSARKPGAFWVIHNAPFERTMMEMTVGHVLHDYICTLQMAVSAFGPDEYDQGTFWTTGLGAIGDLCKDAAVVFGPAGSNDDDGLSSEQGELLAKVIAKESDAAHSYNGWVSQMAWGYGLKQLVLRVFGHKMTSYEEVVGKRAGMHELTGEDVVAYGADDAYWCVRLYHWIMDYMINTNPDVVSTYFHQELPMIEVYSEVWRQGVRIDPEAVRRRRAEERDNFAQVLRELKVAVAQLLPFPKEPHAPLMKSEEWYRKNHKKYRDAIASWALSSDTDDSYTQVQQVRSAVSNAWAGERSDRESTGPNLGHYMPVRVMLYDLLRRERCIVEKGKVQSDGEARGKILQRLEKDGMGESPNAMVLRLLNRIAQIEQRMKLYLTPYLRLVDPDTGRLYPVLSSMLASRRMGTRDPNPMQLQKRGESTYVRGFFKADGPFYSESQVVLAMRAAA